MTTVFSQIIAGELPGHFVWRDERCVVFLSINPTSPGHALVVPVSEVDHWLDLPPDLAAHLMTVAQAVGRAQERVFSTDRVGLVIAGFEVPHTHLHVIPMDSMAALDFANAAPNADHAALAAYAADLVDALDSMGYDPGVTATD